jgi:hypothetical protein
MNDWERHVGAGPNRARIIGFLSQVSADGARVIMPDTATRGDYLNVMAPVTSRRRGRVCSVNVRSGRVEFQTGSWGRLVDTTGFDRLGAGDKAARTVNSSVDVDAVVAVFARECRAA